MSESTALSIDMITLISVCYMFLEAYDFCLTELIYF